MVKRKKKKAEPEPMVEGIALTPMDDLTPNIENNIIEEPEPSDFMKWLSSAPEAVSNLTQRWYGETFQPTYKAWLNEGKQFDK